MSLDIYFVALNKFIMNISNYLIDIGYTNICLYELVSKTTKNIPENDDKEKQKEYMENNFKNYLDEYEVNMGSEELNVKLNLIKKYIKNININDIKEHLIIDYILDVVHPYIKEQCINYPITLIRLTPLFFYTFKETLKNYYLMSNEIVNNYQNLSLKNSEEEEKKEKDFKSQIKSLKINNKNLSKEFETFKKKFDNNDKELKSIINEKDKEIKNLNNSFEQFKMKYDKDLKSLKNSFEQFKTKKDIEIKKLNSKLKIKGKKIKNIKKSITELRNDFEYLNSFQTKLVLESIDNENKIKEYSQQKLELTIYNRKLEILKDLLTSQKNDLEEQISFLKDENIKLKKTGERNNDQYITELKTEIENLKEENQDLKESNESLKKEIINLKEINEKMSDQMLIEKNNYLRERNNEQYQSLMDKKRIKELEIEVNSLKIKIEELEIEINSLKDSE